MTYRRRTGARRPPKKPQDAASGVLYVRQSMLKLYDHEDGNAADWPLIAETRVCQEFCVRGRVDHHAVTNLWSNMMAN